MTSIPSEHVARRLLTLYLAGCAGGGSAASAANKSAIFGRKLRLGMISPRLTQMLAYATRPAIPPPRQNATPLTWPYANLVVQGNHRLKIRQHETISKFGSRPKNAESAGSARRSRHTPGATTAAMHTASPRPMRTPTASGRHAPGTLRPLEPHPVRRTRERYTMGKLLYRSPAD